MAHFSSQAQKIKKIHPEKMLYTFYIVFIFFKFFLYFGKLNFLAVRLKLFLYFLKKMFFLYFGK